MAAVPKPVWAWMRPSKSISTSSHTFLGMRGVEEPPGIIASRLSQPPRTPPERQMIISINQQCRKFYIETKCNYIRHNAVFDAFYTCVSLNEDFQWDGHLLLHCAGVVHMTRDVEELRARVPLPAEAREPWSSAATDCGRHGYRLHVGNGCRATKDTFKTETVVELLSIEVSYDGWMDGSIIFQVERDDLFSHC